MEEIKEIEIVEEMPEIIDAPQQNTFNEDDMRIEGEVENDASENE